MYTNIYYVNTPTKDTYEYFKEGCWYRGLNGDSGIVAKFEGNHSNCSGWWGSSSSLTKEWVDRATPCLNYFRLITPENWVLVSNLLEIGLLEESLNICF